MVTKLYHTGEAGYASSVLAKILMVTKPNPQDTVDCLCSVLAKILMVTKLLYINLSLSERSVLAKILMVTKRPCRPGQIA